MPHKIVTLASHNLLYLYYTTRYIYIPKFFIHASQYLCHLRHRICYTCITHFVALISHHMSHLPHKILFHMRRNTSDICITQSVTLSQTTKFVTLTSHNLSVLRNIICHKCNVLQSTHEHKNTNFTSYKSVLHEVH